MQKILISSLKGQNYLKDTVKRLLSNLKKKIKYTFLQKESLIIKLGIWNIINMF